MYVCDVMYLRYVCNVIMCAMYVCVYTVTHVSKACNVCV